MVLSKVISGVTKFYFETIDLDASPEYRTISSILGG
jgi:hypothetical protein